MRPTVSTKLIKHLSGLALVICIAGILSFPTAGCDGTGGLLLEALTEPALDTAWLGSATQTWAQTEDSQETARFFFDNAGQLLGVTLPKSTLLKLVLVADSSIIKDDQILSQLQIGVGQEAKFAAFTMIVEGVEVIVSAHIKIISGSLSIGENLSSTTQWQFETRAVYQDSGSSLQIATQATRQLTGSANQAHDQIDFITQTTQTSTQATTGGQPELDNATTTVEITWTLQN